MKLVAIRDFRNPDGKIKLDQPAQHPDHIHFGATFSIGGDKALKDLRGDEKTLVGLLSAANCIGDATDRKTMDQVAAELSKQKTAALRTAAKEK